MWHFRPLAVKVLEQIGQETRGRRSDELLVAMATKDLRKREIVCKTAKKKKKSENKRSKYN